MKLGIVELDHHLECLNSLCQLLEDSRIEITVFTTQNLHQELAGFSYAKNIKWLIADANTDLFLVNNKAVFEQQDLLFFSTIESNFKNFNRLKLTTPRIIRIHNANTFLNKTFKWNYNLSPYWLFKDASYFGRKVLLENEIKERNLFVKESFRICFTSDEITEYVKSSQSFLYKEKVINAVPITFNELKAQAVAEVKTLAVIGTIDRKRKDYLFLLDSFTQIKEQLEKPITLKFMGRPKGEFGLEILKKFKAIESEKLKIKFWNKGLSQQEFDNEITNVDLILAPIKPKTKYFLWEEKYGFTKISGSINDCIKYGKKGLIPDFYPVPKSVNTLFENYNNLDEFVNLVLEYVNHSKTIEINNSDLKSLSKANLGKKVAQQFLELKEFVTD